MNELKNLPEVDTAVPLEELDAAVADVLVPHAERGAVQTLGAISDLSDQEPIYAGAAAFLAVAAAMRDGPTWRAGTRILAAHLLATGLRGIVKQLVDRTRPDAAFRRGEYVFGEGGHHESDLNSFPSGHTAGAVAVARAVSREYPTVRPVALGLAVAAGAAQVVRSKHYISDVVAGAVIGWAADTLVDGLIRQARRI
jgi:undecaprenyl-diphosphatase